MPVPKCVIFALAAAMLAMLSHEAFALTLNLAMPYGDGFSRARSQDALFFASDAPDFLFDDADDATIYVQPVRRGLSLEWALHRNGIKTALLTGQAMPEPNNTFALGLPVDQLDPGFYDLRVSIDTGQGDPIQARTTFGYKPDKQQIHTAEPADFDEFWAKAKQSLKTIDLDIQIEKVGTFTGEEVDRFNLEKAALPARYDAPGITHDTVELYKVNFAGAGELRIHGWFAKPAGDGPFPGMLVLPGAGNNPRSAPLEHARHGYAALDIQVHGYDVDLAEYPKQEPDRTTDPAEYRHYTVYLNALQALEALTHLPSVDAEKLVVAGGSQGGRLSLVVAALDDRVDAGVLAITHYAWLQRQAWAQRLNRKKKPGEQPFGQADLDDSDKARAEAYLDVLHFARRVDCPVFMNAGLNDDISPASTVYAVYQSLAGPRTIVPLPNQGHDWSPAFDRKAWRWLDEQLGRVSPPADD